MTTTCKECRVINMKKLFLSLMIVGTVSMGLTGCTVLESLFGDSTVITTSEQLKEGAEFATIPFDQFPEAIREKFPNQKELVVTDKDHVAEGSTFVQLGGELTDGGFEGLLQTVLGVASAFFPSLAAWEAALAFLSRRKRKHWLAAAKAIIPSDKNVNLGGAVTSIGAALGVAHSSEASKAAVEKEEEAEAKKASKKS